VRNMLVMHIRKSEEEDTGEDGAGSGVKQVDLTNWYIGGAAQAEVSYTQPIAWKHPVSSTLEHIK
jgi:hypothetical protein